MPSTTTKKTGNIFLRLHPLHRILISLVFSAAGFFLINRSAISGLLITMSLWCIFSLTYILLSWFVFFTRPVAQIRKLARMEDGSKIFVFVMIIAACFASMLILILLMISPDAKTTNNFMYLPVCIAGILFSWVMVHSIFTFHYAHMYYDDDEDNPHEHARGLSFPDQQRHDYVDFAYFSFVIGMTFQVSDVEITSKKIRRVVLLHSLLSFLLNTIVVALTINFIAGLSK